MQAFIDKHILESSTIHETVYKYREKIGIVHR